MSPKPPCEQSATVTRERVHVSIGGAVQGVGFRPFVYRLAHDEALSGWVCNTPAGVEVEIEGSPCAVHNFLERLPAEAPPHAALEVRNVQSVPVCGETAFRIVQSNGNGATSVIVQPDLATCPQCLAELFNVADRRYRYPFTNCTHCGPRYSIIENLPYDRTFTTMRHFEMCPECREEYDNPLDRRFHAQPNACEHCGPHLEFWNQSGAHVASRAEALQLAVDALRDGQVVAVKGIGGFHLMVDARDGQAVARLRCRKHRAEKPLALMVRDIAQAHELATISRAEQDLLLSAAAPIVLLQRKPEAAVCQEIAPANPNLGVMLAATPLHHLLLHGFGFPLVATSGNVSDEPLCTDEAEAYARLRGIADCYLVHNRPIARPLDDSIVRVIADQPMLMRLGRGYAPLRVPLQGAAPGTLAVGAHQKCTVAVSLKDAAVIGQHLGDLNNALSVIDHQGCAEKLPELYNLPITSTVADLHPDYASTHYAEALALPMLQVQHHYAHALACAAENDVALPALAVSWDGTGVGTDHTVWGGEFLHVTDTGFERVAHLRPFPLPGGEAASRDPRRSAFGLLHAYAGEELAVAFLHSSGCMPDHEIHTLADMVRHHVNSPLTSSVGRMFDAVAMLLGIRCRSSFEGQAAMDVEFLADTCEETEPYSFTMATSPGNPSVIDWSPMITELLGDLHNSRPPQVIAARFHETLVSIIVEVARATKQQQVLLTGGCFQNARLLQRTIDRLAESGFTPIWHHKVPPNDNSISLGQLVAATHMQQHALAHAEVS